MKCWMVAPCRATPLVDGGPKGRYMTEQHIDPATRLDRLDMMLVASGLVESRAKAQRLIKAGHVRVDGETITKPSFMVKAGHSELAVDKGDDYVSRGAYKLLGAFETFAGNGLTGPEGLECLDIGASTGGFTDVLLRGGAAKVVALDVGHGQLDPRIANDEHVIEMSGVNIREVEADDLPYRPAMIVSDVSFISLTYVIPVIARIAAPGAQIVLLVKPQFEVGRAGLGKNGIVEDPALRERALHDVVACAEQHGLDVVATADSPIIGTHGNEEYLLYAVLR
ncbi:TlyA family RNA methyltransferase [Bifidobacterium longum]|nr:TlyA family RNA methyltransferase [Bifidobacterium longum]RHJ32441.1 TlyA family RNA methyltransferase [Bifidobacterium longum]